MKLGYDKLLYSLSTPLFFGDIGLSSWSSSSSSSFEILNKGNIYIYIKYCEMRGKNRRLFLPSNKSIKKNDKYLWIITDLITTSLHLYN